VDFIETLWRHCAEEPRRHCLDSLCLPSSTLRGFKNGADSKIDGMRSAYQFFRDWLRKQAHAILSFHRVLVPPYFTLAWLLEPIPEPYFFRDEVVHEGVLEHRPYNPDMAADGRRFVETTKMTAILAEIAGVKIVPRAILPNVFGEMHGHTHTLVVPVAAVGTVGFLLPLSVQESVDQPLDRRHTVIAAVSGFAAGVQILGHADILCVCCPRVRAEVVVIAPDFLAPLAVSMPEQGVAWPRLFGFRWLRFFHPLLL